jgi:hypothetical protein
MKEFSGDFDRIYKNGGVFLIFAHSRIEQVFNIGQMRGERHFTIEEPVSHLDNWSFLSILRYLTVTADVGEEIAPVDPDFPLGRLVRDHLNSATFSCTVAPTYAIYDQWKVIAKNKYGTGVAGCLAPAKNSEDGYIFVMPRIPDVTGFITGFFADILPEISPALFPYAEGMKWIHHPEYELASVIELQKTIADVQADAAQKIRELQNKVENEQTEQQYFYDLLRATGRPLVLSVIKSLRILGFEAIVDVDIEKQEAGTDSSLREDLRIQDSSPIIIVDVKGVAGHPADAEALQAQKHQLIYMKEQKRTDVHALTIINHQRLLPPLDRDNDKPFRKEILDAASQVELGLMTTWDLFRLTRAFIRHGYQPQNVKPLFYKAGRILPVPLHYSYIGKVKQAWKNAFSVVVESGEVSVGDRIAIKSPVDFDEQLVASIQIDGANIEIGGIGKEIGISRDQSSFKVKSGFPVYRIHK